MFDQLAERHFINNPNIKKELPWLVSAVLLAASLGPVSVVLVNTALTVNPHEQLSGSLQTSSLDSLEVNFQRNIIPLITLGEPPRN